MLSFKNEAAYPGGPSRDKLHRERDDTIKGIHQDIKSLEALVKRFETELNIISKNPKLSHARTKYEAALKTAKSELSTLTNQRDDKLSKIQKSTEVFEQRMKELQNTIDLQKATLQTIGNSIDFQKKIRPQRKNPQRLCLTMLLLPNLKSSQSSTSTAQMNKFSFVTIFTINIVKRAVCRQMITLSPGIWVHYN